MSLINFSLIFDFLKKIILIFLIHHSQKMAKIEKLERVSFAREFRAFPRTSQADERGNAAKNRAFQRRWRVFQPFPGLRADAVPFLGIPNRETAENF